MSRPPVGTMSVIVVVVIVIVAGVVVVVAGHPCTHHSPSCLATMTFMISLVPA
jgi:hypothetical protein